MLWAASPAPPTPPWKWQATHERAVNTGPRPSPQPPRRRGRRSYGPADGAADQAAVHPAAHAARPAHATARPARTRLRVRVGDEFLARVELESVGELLEHRQRVREPVRLGVTVQQDRALLAQHPERDAVHRTPAR